MRESEYTALYNLSTIVPVSAHDFPGIDSIMDSYNESTLPSQCRYELSPPYQRGAPASSVATRLPNPLD